MNCKIPAFVVDDCLLRACCSGNRVCCVMKKNTILILIIAVAAALFGGSFLMMRSNSASSTTEAAVTPAAGEQQDQQATATPASVGDYSQAVIPSNPLDSRSLGNPNAPVKIEEFASLSCSHCAAFHKQVFPELKSKYIDTGKVYFTFSDFPLNAPALDGTLITRCMPGERYFAFLSMLFETQDKWAFSQDYKTILGQNAKLAGMSDDAFNECLANQNLKEGIVARMQSNQTKHGINSTPSFVINGTTVITGALPIDAFDQAIADALKAREETKGQK